MECRRLGPPFFLEHSRSSLLGPGEKGGGRGYIAPPKPLASDLFRPLNR